MGTATLAAVKVSPKAMLDKKNILIPIGKIFTATLCVRAGAAAGGAAVAGPAAAAGAARHPQHVPLHRHPHRAVMSHVTIMSR